MSLWANSNCWCQLAKEQLQHLVKQSDSDGKVEPYRREEFVSSKNYWIAWFFLCCSCSFENLFVWTLNCSRDSAWKPSICCCKLMLCTMPRTIKNEPNQCFAVNHKDEYQDLQHEVVPSGGVANWSYSLRAWWSTHTVGKTGCSPSAWVNSFS